MSCDGIMKKEDYTVFAVKMTVSCNSYTTCYKPTEAVSFFFFLYENAIQSHHMMLETDRVMCGK